jgi:ABC-2 type transport system ATP-binding protein
MHALADGPEIGDAAVFGSGLHASAKAAAQAAARIRERLKVAGIEIRRLEPIEPSMEDVFVALIEEEERKAA